MPRRARRRSRRSTCLSSPGVPPRRLCPRRNACNCRPPLPRAVAQEQARRPRRQARSYSSGGHRAHGSGQRPAVLEVVVHGGAYLLVGERAGTDLACVQVAALLEFPGPVAWEPLFGQPSSLITPAAQCPYLMYSSTALILFSYEYIHSPDVIR